MRFSVDNWDVGYGSSVELDLDDSKAEVDTTVEMAPTSWAPIDPPADPVHPEAVLFVDGVRRIDARVWIDAPATNGTHPVAANAGICASYAAGVMCCCPRGAHLLAFDVRRGLFTSTRAAADIRTDFGVYQVHNADITGETPWPVTLSAALQENLAEAETTMALGARTVARGHREGEDDLLVIDGPLRHRTQLERTVGYIKSHQALYLPHHLNKIVADMTAGQRTPVFHIGGRTWTRYSWYLCLPGKPDTPWAGVVRLEAAPGLHRTAVVELANRTQTVLPRFASDAYKDSRAPQNLYPIGGLERDLRHLLGAKPVMYRALRTASVTVGAKSV
jgi:hypothetical protein